MKILKKVDIVNAWKLGDGTAKEDEMLSAGRIRVTPDGTYRIVSQESEETGGELAIAGDYFKIDSAGYPYPNRREWFNENHIRVSDNLYIQKSRIIYAWNVSEPETDEVRFILKNEMLSIDSRSKEHYFIANIWGTTEYGAKDAIIAFYNVSRCAGKIVSVNFNIIARDEFEKTYEVVEK